MTIHERYVVTPSGKTQAVVLDLREFKNLMERLEDLEDALELKKAVRTAGRFISHSDMLSRLTLP